MDEAEANTSANDPLVADIAIAHGDLLLALPSPEIAAAAVHFEQAVGIATARGARMVEIQALTRLATLRREPPGEEGTRSRLQDLYDTFTEGFDSPQLTAARALLDETT